MKLAETCIRLRQTSMRARTKNGFSKDGHRYYIDGKDDQVYLDRLWSIIMKNKNVYIFEAKTGKNITGFVSFTAFNKAVQTYLSKNEVDFFYTKVSEDQYLNEAGQHYALQNDLRKFYRKILKRGDRVKGGNK